MGARYAFRDCVLDTDLYTLERGGQPVHLTPKAFDLLVYLIQHREQVVSRDDLRQAVWQGIHITDATLDANIWEARQAVGDSGQTQQVISNVPRRGYRFVAPVDNRIALVDVEKQSAAALQGRLTLYIWEPGNPERQGRPVDGRGMLPLQPQDTFRIEAEVNHPAYLYLLWITPQGQPIPLFPWRPSEWQVSMREQCLTRVSLPEDEEEWWPSLVDSASGLETLLLLARETPLSAASALTTRLANLPACVGRHLLKPLRYENWLPQHQGTHRGGIDPGRSVRIPEAVRVARDRHQVLQRHLETEFTYSLSVSFPS